MSYIMVDAENDGPIPGDNSMISFGAILVNESLDQTFYGQLNPISEKFISEALAVSSHTREETLAFEDPKKVMDDFKAWIKLHSKDQPIFISDNNGFDWMFAGTFIILQVEIRLDIAHRIWEAFIKGW